MSDNRLTASCGDCGEWISGTGALDWTREHCDTYPDHRVTVTRSGEIHRDMS